MKWMEVRGRIFSVGRELDKKPWVARKNTPPKELRTTHGKLRRAVCGVLAGQADQKKGRKEGDTQ